MDNNILNDIEKSLLQREEITNKVIDNLSKRVNCDLKDTLQLEAEATSYRQVLVDEKSSYLYKIYKDNAAIKQLTKDKFEYYCTKYQIKTNSSEKGKLIEADLALHQAKMGMLENHVNYLIESIKTVDHVLWSVKNKIELHKIIGEE